MKKATSLKTLLILFLLLTMLTSRPTLAQENENSPETEENTEEKADPLEKETKTLFKDYVGDEISPKTFDFAPAFTSYNFDITSIKEIPLNGAIEFELYLTAGSKPGTILDTYGISNPEIGDIYIDFNDQGILNLTIYNNEAESDCKKGAGFHTLSTEGGLFANYWNKIKISYGLNGAKLYLNEKLESACNIQTIRKDKPVYLGDFPEDRLELSFLGFLRNITVENLDEEIKKDFFTDVKQDHKNYEAIKYLYEQDIIEGYEDGTFRPEDKVNRAEILKILLLGLGKEIIEEFGEEEIFPDVPKNQWFAKFVYTAKILEIINGYPDGHYYPEQNVNRVEFLKILLLSTETDLEKIEISQLYPDTDTEQWYAPYVQFSFDNNLVDTDEYGNFTPGAFMKRGEVAEAMYRLLTISENKEFNL